MAQTLKFSARLSKVFHSAQTPSAERSSLPTRPFTKRLREIRFTLVWVQNVLVRALGSEESVEPDLEDHEFTPGDILLLCSDGLSRYVKESMIMEVIRGTADLEQACENLIDAAKSGGSDDNITCLLLRAVEQR